MVRLNPGQCKTKPARDQQMIMWDNYAKDSRGEAEEKFNIFAVTAPSANQSCIFGSYNQ
jgi:hypothetical protein